MPGLGVIKKGDSSNIGNVIGKPKGLGPQRRKLAWLEVNLRSRHEKLGHDRSGQLLENDQESAKGNSRVSFTFPRDPQGGLRTSFRKEKDEQLKP
jgi:hypothetical protein